MGYPLRFSYFLNPIVFALLLASYSVSVFSKEYLISEIISHSKNVSYLAISPLSYKAKRKNMGFIQVSPETYFEKKSAELRPMELIIYSTCDRVDPQQGSVLGLHPQFLHSHLLLSPHPDDLPASYYLSPLGLFRMFRQIVAGRPYFKEKGIIRVFNVQDTVWHVNIVRGDITATNSKTDYSIEFSNFTDQPLFIQALKSAAKPESKSKVPQVAILLESPNLHVEATYNLIHKGKRNYQPFKKMNIIDLWNKQQIWCPRIKSSSPINRQENFFKI